eukprot:6502378-Prymnesium_polylepis.1
MALVLDVSTRGPCAVARGRATISAFFALSLHAVDRWRMVPCFPRAARYHPPTCRCHAGVA